MRVKMLKEQRLKLSSLSTKVCPVDSTPDIPDETAEEWIDNGIAVPYGDDDEDFSETERAILKHVAAQFASSVQDGRIDFAALSDEQLAEIAAHIELDIEGKDRDAIVAEMTELHDDIVAALQQPEPLDFDALSKDDLVEIAEKLEIAQAKRMNKSTLVAKLTDRHDEVVALIEAEETAGGDDA